MPEDPEGREVTKTGQMRLWVTDLPSVLRIWGYIETQNLFRE